MDGSVVNWQTSSCSVIRFLRTDVDSRSNRDFVVRCPTSRSCDKLLRLVFYLLHFSQQSSVISRLFNPAESNSCLRFIESLNVRRTRLDINRRSWWTCVFIRAWRNYWQFNVSRQAAGYVCNLTAERSNNCRTLLKATDHVVRTTCGRSGGPKEKFLHLVNNVTNSKGTSPRCLSE